MKVPIRTALLFLVLGYARSALAQTAPVSPDRPWHGIGEQRIESEAKRFHESRLSVDPNKEYSLPELIDLAESHNPEARIAWEGAVAQLAALGVARSELYPTLTAIALSDISRDEIPFGTQFYRQTNSAFEGVLELNYLVFDFGGRASRIAAAKAQLLASNFAFNDTHRKLIYQVAQTYYRLLNAIGQEEAARAGLMNAQTVQQAAEERLNNGLATLPDLLEARSATAQAEYDLQSVLGAEEIVRGDLATALGASATLPIRIQPLSDLSVPDSLSGTVEQAINRAFEQRPDLLQQLAGVRAANARIKEARAAYYPTLSLNAMPAAESLYGLQQQLPSAHTAGLTGSLTLSLSWTVFDAGARKNRLAQAEADSRAAQAQVNSTRDQIADEIWRAYSNLKTALRQRQSALALVQAASKSYSAELESYTDGVRSFLDVTAAQRALAQARSADVLARTQVLTAIADLAFQSGDAVHPAARRNRP